MAKVGYAIPLAIASKAEVAANINAEIDKVIKSGADAKTFADKICAYINEASRGHHRRGPTPRQAPASRQHQGAAAGDEKAHRQDSLWALGFLTPQLVGLLVFMLGPLIFAVILGFSSWDGFGSRTFVGFDNFIGVLQDPQLRQSWINTAWFTVLQLPGLMIFGFLFAFLIQKAGRLKSVYRVFFAAGDVEHRRRRHLAVATEPRNQPAQHLPGPDRATDAGLAAGPATAIPAIAFVSIWQALGFT